MQKTDSVLNLTKPSLYGIYNSSSTNLNSENEEVEEYIDGAKLHIKSEESRPATSRRPSSIERKAPPTSIPVLLFKFMYRVAVVVAAASAYNEVTRNIHTTHVDGNGADINAFLTHFMGSFKPTTMLPPENRSGSMDMIDRLLTLFFEGLALSSIVPALDKYMPSWGTKRVLTSNPDPKHRANLTNDIIRSSIAFLGISYAIRNIEWKSSLQMAMTWTLINPGLWLILDGTLNGFVGSISVAFVGSAVIYIQSGGQFVGDSENLFTIFLFIASFFFCGVIIFGKLGRFLFGQR
ncbi:hypothetical protein OXX80_000988 [Metschnikowia pulcherrima]